MRKVEIHVFPDKTSGCQSYRISLFGFIVSLTAVVVAAVGYFIFSPCEIIDNVSDGDALAVYRQNKDIESKIKEIRRSVDASIMKAEEVRLLRDSTISMGGLAYTLEDFGEEFELDMPRKSLTELHRTFKKLLDTLEKDPALAASIPVIHPMKNGRIIKNRFEMIFDTFTEQDLPHRGMDFVAHDGDTVYATGAGVVVEERSHRGFGLSMKIQHMKGVRTFYAHLGKTLVHNGAKVRRGEPIAIIGESGRESSLALHYEIRLQGEPINPEDYFITK